MQEEVEVQLRTFLTYELGGASRPGHFTLGEGAPFPLDRRMGEALSRSGRWVEERNLLLLTEIEPRFLGRLVRSLVPVPTEPLRLPTVR
jgi:hypothetical protein